MTVRRALPADAPAIARVHVASWQAAYQMLIPTSRLARFTVPRRTAAWTSNLRDRPTHTAVFEGPTGITGFASRGASRALPAWGEIWALYVAPRSWGCGVGSALFADAMAALAGQGLPRVVIWVLDGNHRALDFYEGNGFVLDGTRAREDGYPQVRMRFVPR